MNQVRDGFIKYLLIRIKFHRIKAYLSITIQRLERPGEKKLHCRLAPQTFETFLNPVSHSVTHLQLW